MIKKLWIISLIFVLTFGIFLIGTKAQERAQDKEIQYSVRFKKGKSGTVIKKQIPLGTSHVYTLRANQGQNMKVVLTTGNKTSMTIYSPSEGIIEDADGVKRWNGSLNETGEYQITVGTDKTADYILEIFIK